MLGNYRGSLRRSCCPYTYMRIKGSLRSVSVRRVRSWIVFQDPLAMDFRDLDDDRSIEFPKGSRLLLGVPPDTSLPKQAEGDEVI
jgi:hypothetical protein